VTINNGLGPESPLATPMTFSMTAFDNAGGTIGSTSELFVLAPGELMKLDIDAELAGIPGVPSEGPLLIMLHGVPTKWRDESSIDVSTLEMITHARASDDFIEYYQRPKGVVTGVAYQTGPLNDRRFSSTRTTVCQAPKVIVTEPVDTLFTLMNASTHADYSDTVRMDFWILGRGGERLARHFVEVPPFSFRMVSATEVLERCDALEDYRARGGLGMFLGFSKNGTLVPISMTLNRKTGAIACDHTLPPAFYFSTWGGDARLRANARLEHELFTEVSTPLAPGQGART
jgi:hypothetical protein